MFPLRRNPTLLLIQERPQPNPANSFHLANAETGMVKY
jgi:hypothetical protein